MHDNGMHKIIQQLFRFCFYDNLRLFELFSALNLLAWAYVFWVSPDLLLRDSYSGFSMFGAQGWALIFFGVAGLQAFGMGWHGQYSGEVRFVAMAFAAGAWTVVAVNFLTTGVSTTAPANYVLIAIMSMISGAYLGWKSTF